MCVVILLFVPAALAGANRADLSGADDAKIVPAGLPTVIHTTRELRLAWMRAVRDRTAAAIEIFPGAHLALRGRALECDASIRLTVFSSGRGATLDGENRSRIFKLNGCSLTLQGLSLINGIAPAALREACRNPTTGKWTPYEDGRQDGYERMGPYKAACSASVRAVPKWPISWPAAS